MTASAGGIAPTMSTYARRRNRASSARADGTIPCFVHSARMAASIAVTSTADTVAGAAIVDGTGGVVAADFAGVGCDAHESARSEAVTTERVGCITVM